MPVPHGVPVLVHRVPRLQGDLPQIRLALLRGGRGRGRRK